MQEIYLFRHGEPKSEYRHTYLGQTDAALSDLGTQQNKKTNDFLKNVSSSIYTSTLQRTFLQINEPIKKSDLCEINFGLWEGLSWAEIELNDPINSANYLKNFSDFTFPNGESYASFRQRVLPSFLQLATDKPIALVVHAGTIRAIAASVLHLELDQLFSFKIDYGAYVLLEKINDSYLLKTWNHEI